MIAESFIIFDEILGEPTCLQKMDDQREEGYHLVSSFHEEMPLAERYNDLLARL